MMGLRAASLKVVIATIDLDNVCHNVLLAHDHKCTELSKVGGDTPKPHDPCGDACCLPLLSCLTDFDLHHLSMCAGLHPVCGVIPRALPAGGHPVGAVVAHTHCALVWSPGCMRHL
jgi:hypothetical protein